MKSFVKIPDSTGPPAEALQSKLAALSPSQQGRLARQLGYDSFESLLAASMVMLLDDRSAWCLTPDRCGAWTAWNVCAIDQPQQFGTRDEALATLRERRS
jgi:hypothetical protein